MDNDKPKNNRKNKVDIDLSLLITDPLLLNQFYTNYSKEINNLYFISPKDIKLFKFLLKYLFKFEKYKDIQILCQSHLIFISKNKKIINKKYVTKNKVFAKFINFVLLNESILTEYINIDKDLFNKNIYIFLKILFLNDSISSEDINIILIIKLIIILYSENIDIFKDNIINNDIKNIKEFHLLIDFLLSFIDDDNIKSEKINEFNNLIHYFVKNIQNIILKNNINNIFILSRNNYFFKLIKLCKISEEISRIIIPLLTNVYKNKFNIDYIFEDLSEQFLLKENQNILVKTNYLMAKNVFLNMLFLLEEKKKDEISINSGFIFNNYKNNGITCYNPDLKKINFPRDGFSIAISFCFMKNKNSQKYNIFSFFQKDKNNILSLFMENCVLKLYYNSQIYDLFSDIKINKNYIFWMFFPKEKKSELLFYLNNSKKILPHIKYPSNEYNEIFIGFNRDLKYCNCIDNFEGILGTFILFNQCLLKDKNDNQNEIKLIELKGDYEQIVNIGNKRDFSFLNKNANLILNRYFLDNNDISQYIEIIISTKSLGINCNNIESNKNDINFICNYFDYSLEEKKNSFKFKFNSEKSIINNISYPFEFNNSFLQFLKSYGIIYLQLELFYLMGVLSKLIHKNNNFIFEEKDIKEANLNLTKILSLFFYCFNSKIYIEEINQNEINNFFYTLNDIISLYAKYGFKIRSLLLSLFINNLQGLLTNNLLIEKCEFIFKYDNYDEKDVGIFIFLFQSLSNFIEENEYFNNNKLIKIIFQKMIYFEKIYLNKNISKESKKRYSELIQKLILKSLMDKENIFFEIFSKRLKQLKEELKINAFYWEEDNDGFNTKYINERNYANDFDSSDEINDNKKLKINNSLNIIKQKEINLILLYKYLKNLFISIDSPKFINNFLYFYLGKEAKIKSFFNEIIIDLQRKYNKNIIFDNIKETDLKYIELIKSICIQFIDQISYEKNVKEIKEYEEKINKSNRKSVHKSQKNLGSFHKQNMPPEIKGSFIIESKKNSFIINNEKNLSNSIIEGVRENKRFRSSNSINNRYDFNKKEQDIIYIITKNFEFFNNIILSPYLFLSFYLLLFKQKINNKKILKMIKHYNSSRNNDLILNSNDFQIIKYYIDLISLLIEKIGNCEKDCQILLMKKDEFFEFCFDIYNGMQINALNYYIKNDSPKKKELLNYLFKYKCNCFYEMVFNIASYFLYWNNNIFIDGNEIIRPKQNEEKSTFIESFLKKIKDNLNNIISKTIYEIKDPFYFVFLNKIFLNDNKNIDFVLETISFIMDKYISFDDKNLNNNKEINEEEKFNKLMTIELNNKNLLLLIYKIFFYIPKRKIIIKKEKFIKNIYIYFSTFLSNSKLLYLKILFPIVEDINEEVVHNDDNKTIYKKLVIEMLFELLLELYLEYVRDTKKIHLQIFEDLLYDLLNIKNLATHKYNESIMENYDISKKKKKINHTSFYAIDKISFKLENIFKITDGIKIKTEILKKMKEYIFKNYKSQYKEKENIFSICIIFIVKILITIRDINELLLKMSENSFKKIEDKKEEKDYDTTELIYEDKDTKNNIQLKNILISTFNQLCQDSLKIYNKYPQFSPFISEGKYNNGLYSNFKNFIIKDYTSSERHSNINILTKKLSEHAKYLRNFSRVIFNFDGSIILYTYKNYMKNIRIPIKNEPVLINNDNDSRQNSISLNSDINTNSTSNHNLNRNNSFDSNNSKIKEKRINFKNVLNFSMRNNIKRGSFIGNNMKRIYNDFDIINKKEIKNFKDYNCDTIYSKIYIKKINFKAHILKIIFSSYFNKILTNDKDFINIKKLYRYFFGNDLNNIDEFNNFESPQKIKNYISPNHYIKLFYTKDFDFFDNNFFEYSHKYAFKETKKKKRRDITNRLQTSYKKQWSVLFPSKEILKQYDFPNYNFKRGNININNYYFCELLFNKGSIYGKIFIFENGILFLSDWENDNRNKNKLIEFACSSLEYDCLNENKKIFIFYDQIKEVINRYFCFCWISQEIFLKDGRSYLFNFFNEKKNDEIFEIFKSKKIPKIVKNPKEFFEKSEFSKKWKEGEISNYDYLLLLNKYSSRSYNDTNQYPVMPWIHLSDNRIRNFDLPISLQEENIIEEYKKKFSDNYMYQNNHYSTSAYIYFYLMRINPFSNNMIKFQSNDFDIPDRQFISIKDTLELCEQCNNNREAIPEIYEIPEIFYNINYNDFGRLKNKTRIHNLNLKPYAQNGIEFCCKIKNRMNYDIEINKKIQQWFDFIFGVNQWSSNPKDNLFRQFSQYSYAQNVNIKKTILELKKQKNEDKAIYDIIRNNVGYAINFGQCPQQIFSEPHPIKNDNFTYENNLLDKKGEFFLKIKDKNNYKLTYFYKNKYNKIVCLLENGSLEIYNLKKKSNTEYELFKKLEPKGLLDKDLLNKYFFCEAKEDLFIFCGYLDKTLKIFYDKYEIKYVLDIYVTSIIRINDIQFITGHDNGNITKWIININNINNQIDLKLIKNFSIKSNNNRITCLEYNQKLNILLSSDNDSIIIRNYYNFEFLAHIKIYKKKDFSNKIINIKISNYNLVYALIQIKDNSLYELLCFTLNGAFVCKMEGNFSEFELTNSGNIIIPDLKNRLIKVLRPYDLFLIHSNSYSFLKNNKNQFHIFYENSNSIYLSFEENNYPKITKLKINKTKETYFI